MAVIKLKVWNNHNNNNNKIQCVSIAQVYKNSTSIQ